MDDEIKEAVKKRDRLRKLASQTNNINAFDRENFRISRGEVNISFREPERI